MALSRSLRPAPRLAEAWEAARFCTLMMRSHWRNARMAFLGKFALGREWIGLIWSVQPAQCLIGTSSMARFLTCSFALFKRRLRRQATGRSIVGCPRRSTDWRSRWPRITTTACPWRACALPNLLPSSSIPLRYQWGWWPSAFWLATMTTRTSRFSSQRQATAVC